MREKMIGLGGTAGAVRVRRALLAAVALVAVIALIPLNSTSASLFDSRSLRPADIQTGTLSIDAVAGTAGAMKRTATGGVETYDDARLGSLVLEGGESATVSENVEVSGDGTNLVADLTVTIDTSDMPKGLSLGEATITEISSKEGTSGTVVARASGSSLTLDSLPVDGTTFYRITYTVTHDDTLCLPGSCRSVGTLPAVTIDLTQER